MSSSLSCRSTEAMGDQEVDQDEIRRQKAIILSMTLHERYNPAELHGQRRQRVARGSGTSVKDVNALLKSFKEMRKQIPR